MGLAVPAAALASGPTGATKATGAIAPSRGTAPDSPPGTPTLVDLGPTGGTGPTGCDGPTGNVGATGDVGPTGAIGSTGAGASPGDSGTIQPTDPTQPADPPDGVGPTGDAVPTLYYCMYALDMVNAAGSAPMERDAVPAAALVTSAHTNGWWWLVVAEMTVLSLVATPRAVRQKASAYFKR